MSRGSSGVVTAVEQIVVVKVAGRRNRDQKGQKAQAEVHVFGGDPNLTFWVAGNNGRNLVYWGKRVASGVVLKRRLCVAAKGAQGAQQ